jgi:threonine aldolase
MFQNNLYFELAQHTNDLAQTLRNGIKEKGYSFLVDSPTNQLFPIFPNDLVEKLEGDYFFYRWSPYDKENTVVRLVTSFTSTEDEIQQFLGDI